MFTEIHHAPSQDALIDFFNDEFSKTLNNYSVNDTLCDLIEITNFNIQWIFKLDGNEIISFYFTSGNIEATETIADILTTFFG